MNMAHAYSSALYYSTNEQYIGLARKATSVSAQSSESSKRRLAGISKSDEKLR